MFAMFVVHVMIVFLVAQAHGSHSGGHISRCFYSIFDDVLCSDGMVIRVSNANIGILPILEECDLSQIDLESDCQFRVRRRYYKQIQRCCNNKNKCDDLYAIPRHTEHDRCDFPFYWLDGYLTVFYDCIPDPAYKPTTAPVVRTTRYANRTSTRRTTTTHSTTTKPAASTTTKPAASTTTKSAVSTTTKPAASTTTKPAASTTTKPAASTKTKPAASTTTKPAASTTTKPAPLTTTTTAVLTETTTVTSTTIAEALSASIRRHQLGLILGMTFTGIIFTVIIVIVSVVCIKKKRTKKSHENSPNARGNRRQTPHTSGYGISTVSNGEFSSATRIGRNIGRHTSRSGPTAFAPDSPPTYASVMSPLHSQVIEQSNTPFSNPLYTSQVINGNGIRMSEIPDEEPPPYSLSETVGSTSNGSRTGPENVYSEVNSTPRSAGGASGESSDSENVTYIVDNAQYQPWDAQNQ